jgi:hypothetical protein
VHLGIVRGGEGGLGLEQLCIVARIGISTQISAASGARLSAWLALRVPVAGGCRRLGFVRVFVWLLIGCGAEAAGMV